jgi:hypothetical protein
MAQIAMLRSDLQTLGDIDMRGGDEDGRTGLTIIRAYGGC